jgi:hypothetical protein
LYHRIPEGMRVVVLSWPHNPRSRRAPMTASCKHPAAPCSNTMSPCTVATKPGCPSGCAGQCRACLSLRLRWQSPHDRDAVTPRSSALRTRRGSPRSHPSIPSGIQWYNASRSAANRPTTLPPPPPSPPASPCLPVSASTSLRVFVSPRLLVSVSPRPRVP